MAVDLSQVGDVVKDKLLQLFLDRLKEMGADVEQAGEKALEAASLGAKFVMKKTSGDGSADNDLVIVEGLLLGIAANAFAQQTDKDIWLSFAKGALQALISALPTIISILVSAA